MGKKSAEKAKTKPQLAATLATLKKRKKFLEVFAQTGNVTLAAAKAGVHRGTHHKWMKDPKYAKEFASAKEEAADRLEHEARHRGMQGVERYAGFYQGRPVMHAVGEPNPETGKQKYEPVMIREPSDALLTLLLKGNRPEKFRERHEVTGPDGAEITFTINVDDNNKRNNNSDV